MKLLTVKDMTINNVKNTSSNGGASKVDKKLSCRREALRCIMLFCFITRGQSRSFEMASLSLACVSPYLYSIVTMPLSCTVSEIFSIK